MGKGKASKIKVQTVKKIQAKHGTDSVGTKKKSMSPANDFQLMNKKEIEKLNKKTLTEITEAESGLFFKYNEELGPPYHVLVDTNFLTFAISAKLDLIEGMMDCLLAKVTIYIPSCVIAELEKLGSKYRMALHFAKDSRFEILTCDHKGTYADDCIVHRVTNHRCYIVATNDKALKHRLRKIPGVPIMYLSKGQFSIERLPDAYGAPRKH